MLRALFATIGLLVIIGIAGAAGGLYVLHTFGRDLPDHRQLAAYEPPVMTRVHAGDGRLLAEYAIERRVFVPIQAMPKLVVSAFLAAEDKNFYTHPGIDLPSVVRAVVVNLKNLGSGRRLVGASTITQQVAKNFLLTSEVSWERKVKEAILAVRIERALPKDRILELYLNEIYLGFGSYGVAAAALNYFNKSLDELEIHEAAFLAALPKAPNNYHPLRKAKAAVGRRNWVLSRMAEDRHIGPGVAELAREAPLKVATRAETEFISAPYFAEEVRRELADRYGENNLYEGGLSVRTTVDPRLQTIAENVLRDGLEAYDRRHGWTGPVGRLAEGTRLDMPGMWRSSLERAPLPKGVRDNWQAAVVLGADEKQLTIGLADGSEGRIPMSELTWARARDEEGKRGPKVQAPGEVAAPGDVILVEPVTDNGATGDELIEYASGTFGLRQIPDVEGGIVALDPHTGRILALSGGWDFEKSQFNRVTQAARQPGSAFKPFVYLAALDQGYTPSTLILDAPFVIDQGPGLPKWRPANYTKKFYGPSTMRLGIEKSRNLMTVRLAQTIGMEKVSTYAKRFGINDNMPETLSMSLGAGETSLLRLTAAYGMLVNGGKRITPTVIDRIQDRLGRTVFRHDTRECPKCRETFWTEQAVPGIPDLRAQLANPGSAYQVVAMLEGVVQRGTGRRIKAVGKPLAGKTGTTNQERDTWFIGFSPDLAVGVFIGYDEPTPLGRRETGSSVAAPVFRDFMQQALDGEASIPFRIPPGIRLVRINGRTGQLARPGDKNVVLEPFKPGTLPRENAQVVEGVGWTPGAVATPATGSGTGGLY